MAECTCADPMAMGGDYELGCPVHDETAIENARREKGVLLGRAIEAIPSGAAVAVLIDPRTGSITVRPAKASDT